MTRSGFLVWFTGLPCSGKSTLAHALAKRLNVHAVNCEVLDGDVVRPHLSAELGFSREDRDTNVRRIGFVANLLVRNGVAVIVAAISPYRESRNAVRRDVARFVEIHVDCAIEVCEERDVKGMYAQARAGQRPRFTGIDDPYEPPLHPELTVLTGSESVDASLDRVLAVLQRLGHLRHTSPLESRMAVHQR